MLNFITRGQVDHPPLLFLHGFLGAKEDWNEVMAALEKRFYCIAIDLPGHGSPLTDNFPKILEKTLRHQKLEKVVLVGYSMGGRLALMAAKELPELFSRTIVISAHPGLREEKEKVQRLDEDLKWERLLKTSHLEEFVALWYQQPLFDSLRKKRDLFAKVVKRRVQHNASSLSSVLHLYGLGVLSPTLHFSPQTFFLCGEKDLKYTELYKKIVPSKQLKILKECGHALHLETPEACANTLEQLLTR
ncbi:MAG: alpha/beta fold hydrolase [Chlamydiales bacterium]